MRCLSICLLMFAITKSSNAQEVYLELKMDYNTGNLKYRSGDNIKGEVAELGEVRNFSIAASAQVAEHLFIKSSLSSSNFNSKIDVEWSNFGNDYTLDGYIRGQQTVFEFLPEIRYFKNNWLFVNAGIGIVDMSNGEFYRGEATINGSSWEVEGFGGYYHNFVANIGANIQRDIVGVIVEIGYRNSGYVESNDAPFRMGFKQFGVKLGVSYRLRDAKESIKNNI